MTFEDLLLKLSYATVHMFWPVQLIVAAGVVILAVKTRRSWTSGRQLAMPWKDAIPVLAFLVPYVLFMVVGVAFTYHDNEYFLDTTRGQSLPLMIWPDIGRYFPLQMQEFNVLRHISTTALFYQSMVAVQLVVFCGFLLVALADVGRLWRILAVILALCSNSIGIVFADPIYPERNIVFAMAIMIIAVQRFDASPSRLNLIVAVLAAHISLYYKETMFLLVGVFATIRLFAAWRRAHLSGWSWLRDRQLEIALLIVCVVFAGQLAASLLAARHSEYVSDATVGPLAALVRYARTDMWLVALIPALALRVRRLRALGDFDQVWDSLILSAVAYLVALVALGLYADRYAPPLDLVIVLYLAREAARWWSTNPSWRWLLATASTSVACAVMVLGAFRLVEHKSVVQGTVKLASFLDQYATGRPGEVRVFFPNSQGWRVMNLAGYLHYRYPATYERIHLRGPDAFAGGLCAYWRDYRCEHAVTAEPGDLVAHLPDDTKRESSGRDRILFDYSWVPGGIPGTLGNLLYPEAPLYDGKKMPRDWLKASAALRE